MATGFGNKDTRNWVKACLAVKCVRNGLIPLVLKYCLDHYDGNIREVRSVCKLQDYTCRQCNVEELEPFHKGNTKCKYGRCGCKVNNKKSCKNNGACGVIYDQIQAHHTTNDPNWSNTKSNLWSRSPWEQMKCYINTPGYTKRTNIDDADITALIQICLNYTPLKKLFDRNVYDMDKVRTLRNDIYHSGTMDIPNDQLKNIISQMKTFLKLSVFKDFQSDIKCQLENLRKLDNDTFEITADTEEAARSDALRGVQESVAELISNQRLLGKQIDGLLEIGQHQKENCNSRFETVNDKIEQTHLELLDQRRQTAEDTKLQNEHMQTLQNTQLEHGAVLKDFEKNTRADHEQMFKKIEEILECVKQLRGLNLEDAPTVSDSKVTIHAHDVDKNVEGILSDKMFNAAKSTIQKTKVDSENEELIPPFENAISVLTKDGNEITNLKKKCVEIYIESPTIRSWMTLCADFFNGNIERAFQPLQQCLRTHDEYKNLILEIRLDAEYFFQCMKAVTDNLYEQINLQKQEIVQKESSTAVVQCYDLTDTDSWTSNNDQERQIKLEILRGGLSVIIL
ncbi:hypothetical protein DPMN_027967 [Dreissena polymorpha]|uniref:Uncharacterized protein n=1 Tax=Dreissena polymorpha TaxID=45954 RepID=A0A9D4LW51_DREPO|nr:hypothetical protein DPMN_027967 [Dreissena polymorpha]